MMALSFAAMGLMFWALWGPMPEIALVPGLLVPPITLGLAALKPAAFSMGFAAPGNQRYRLGYAVAMSSVAVAFCAWRSYQLLSLDLATMTAIGAAIVVGAVFAVLVGIVDRQEMSDGLMLVFSGAAWGAWAAALILVANGLGPAHSVITRSAVVTDMGYWTKRSGDRNYHAVLLFPTTGESYDAPVSSSVYGHLQKGEAACITETRGFLRLKWTKVDACQRPTSSARPLATVETLAPDNDNRLGTILAIVSTLAAGLVGIAWAAWLATSIPRRDVRLLRERLERNGQKIQSLRRAGTQFGGRGAPTFRKYEVTLTGTGSRPSIRIYSVQATLFFSPEIREETSDHARVGR